MQRWSDLLDGPPSTDDSDANAASTPFDAIDIATGVLGMIDAMHQGPAPRARALFKVIHDLCEVDAQLKDELMVGMPH